MCMSADVLTGTEHHGRFDVDMKYHRLISVLHLHLSVW